MALGVSLHPLVSHNFLISVLVGAWQPYAVQFFLFIQHAPPLRVALYFIPNALVGPLAVYLVQYTFHRFSSH